MEKNQLFRFSIRVILGWLFVGALFGAALYC